MHFDEVVILGYAGENQGAQTMRRNSSIKADDFKLVAFALDFLDPKSNAPLIF